MDMEGYDIPAEIVVSSSCVSIRDYMLRDRKTLSFTGTLKKWKVPTNSQIFLYLWDEMGKLILKTMFFFPPLGFIMSMM